MYFYPRSPCGERRPVRPAVPGWNPISIHALLAESDISCAWSASKLGDFYPRSPCGERPPQPPQGESSIKISIHALLAESDHAPNRRPYRCNNFYPRSPCGERPSWYACSIAHTANFYPRSPCGERHNINSSVNTADQISIHALLAESDRRGAVPVILII